ncbi:pentapeptide repeat-containing protein [Microbacterium sp. NPDC089321]|uniref:pentapeptide repeat-containing protein n=1 Tax=Microbacterium sp. NPDC089321 TaxID=3155183 RepID=UPI00342A57A6
MASRRTALRPPLVSEPDLPDTLSPAAPRRSSDLRAALIDIDGDADLAHSTLEQCVISGSGSAVDLEGATMMDVDVRDLRVAKLSARRSTLRRVRISGGRIGTLDLSDSGIHELALHDVRIDYLTLAGGKAVDVRVDSCRIAALDIPGATLSRVAFAATSSDEVDPRGMRAEHLDLRGLDALGFLDVTALRGATLTLRQVELLAPVFAAAAGIVISD